MPEKVNQFLKDHQGDVELEKKYDMEGWWLLRACKPGVKVRSLCKHYQLETLREYRLRSRRQINQARKQGKRI